MHLKNNFGVHLMRGLLAFLTLSLSMPLFASESVAATRSVLATYSRENLQVLDCFDKLASETRFLADPEYERLMDAVRFAAFKHKDQTRKSADKSPYIIHPLTVCTLLVEEGQCRDAVALTAAILHDTIEDTATTQSELAASFDDAVACCVAEVSDDKSLPKAERKRLQIEHAPHSSQSAKLVKLADKLANLRDLSMNPPEDWSEERIAEYRAWALAVVAGLRGTNSILEASIDIAIGSRI